MDTKTISIDDFILWIHNSNKRNNGNLPIIVNEMQIEILNKSQFNLEQNEKEVFSEIQRLVKEKRCYFDRAVRINDSESRRELARNIFSLDQDIEKKKFYLDSLQFQLMMVNYLIQIMGMMEKADFTCVIQKADLEDLVNFVCESTRDGIEDDKTAKEEVDIKKIWEIMNITSLDVTTKTP